MNKFTIKSRLTVLVISILWSTSSLAGSAKFAFGYKNHTSTKLYGYILHSDGREQKSYSVQPKSQSWYNFGSKCKKSHSRRYEIYELENNTKIAEGKFTYKTGSTSLSACKKTGIKFNTCTDTNTSDSFSISCKKLDALSLAVVIN